MDESNNKQSHHFSFAGEGFEYFKIWIVNILLSIITLGIYSAWATVRTKRYFYSNTFLDDSTFDYHATGWSILKGRIIAVVVFLIYILTVQVSPLASGVFPLILMLVLPLIIWSALRFNARMSSYRNIKFDFIGSCFDIYKYVLLIPAIPVIIGLTVGVFGALNQMMYLVGIALFFTVVATFIIIPWTQALFSSYFLNNLQFGQGQFSAKISTAFYYKTYGKAFGIALFGSAMAVGVSFLLVTSLGLDVAQVFTPNGLDPATKKEMLFAAAPSFLFLYISLFIVMTVVRSYIQIIINNYTFSQLKLDTIAEFSANYSLWRFMQLQSINILLLVFTSGLAYPWVKVRIANFTVDGLTFITTTDLSEYVDEQKIKRKALGDELGEAFDTNVDVGLTF